MVAVSRRAGDRRVACHLRASRHGRIVDARRDRHLPRRRGAAAWLDGFDRYDTVDMLGTKGAHPHRRLGVAVHRTRGTLDGHVVRVQGIPTLSIPATLALLAPVVGIGPTARALDSALLLGQRVDKTLPRSWFQRVTAHVLATAGIRLVDEFAVRDHRGAPLAELDLADPTRKVGVECQSWQWNTTPTAQHRDARRRGMLRQLAWEIVDVWWSDLRHPDRVISELLYLLRNRNCPSDLARSREM